jgi:hypothetical protein
MAIGDKVTLRNGREDTMMRSTWLLGLTMLLGVAVAAPGNSLAADPPPISHVVTIDTNGKTDMLLAEAKKNEKIFERLGIQARRRYMQATLAGPNTGTLIVVIEYPSLSAMAAAQEKLGNDAEWQKYIDKIRDAEMTIENMSVWAEITP